MTVELDEQQTDSCPNQFSDSYDECNKYSGTGGHTQTIDWHEESSLSSTQLQGHEEKQVGEKRGESQYQDTLQEVHAGHDDQQDEEYFQGRTDSAP